MKYFDWDIEKNKKLKKERGVSFEEVALMLEKEDVLDLFDQVFIIKIRGYCFTVPFVEDEEKYFLKTIIPSRKATKKYDKI